MLSDGIRDRLSDGIRDRFSDGNRDIRDILGAIYCM
ncbi:hypothetical protein EhVM1_000019 [Emiliania huxleyi virus M1]|nr:hypothetical protein EhVM1_000019 [Emiliania huxleyi virus M1]